MNTTQDLRIAATESLNARLADGEWGQARIALVRATTGSRQKPANRHECGINLSQYFAAHAADKGVGSGDLYHRVIEPLRKAGLIKVTPFPRNAQRDCNGIRIPFNQYISAQ